MKIKSSQKAKIAQFLKALNEKNYALAHKYLKSVINEKLTTKINNKIEKL